MEKEIAEMWQIQKGCKMYMLLVDDKRILVLNQFKNQRRGNISNDLMFFFIDMGQQCSLRVFQNYQLKLFCVLLFRKISLLLISFLFYFNRSILFVYFLFFFLLFVLFIYFTAFGTYLVFFSTSKL